MAVIAPPRQPDSHDAETSVQPDWGGEALNGGGLPRGIAALTPTVAGRTWLEALVREAAAMDGVGSASTTDSHIPLGMTAGVRLCALDQSGAAHLNVLPNIGAAAEDCADAAAPGVEWVSSDIVGALATRPGLSTIGPVAVTTGGLSGQQIDVSLAAGWTGTCSGDGPIVPLVFATDLIWWGAEPGEQFRITVLDVANLPSGKHATVMIVIYSAEAAAWNDHLSASTRIIETFEFDTTPPHP